ncbi:hypothetical protein CASFOL_027740 [Castilleja foliolosa]|uniref:Uncharacterized protein n=1 Tax=Castilleja foliolosa TaxID=1961234 RepID=A0ABD3CGN4_9LAMI
MAKNKSISWPKKFNPSYPKRGIFVIIHTTNAVNYFAGGGADASGSGDRG